MTRFHYAFAIAALVPISCSSGSNGDESTDTLGPGNTSTGNASTITPLTETTDGTTGDPTTDTTEDSTTDASTHTTHDSTEVTTEETVTGSETDPSATETTDAQTETETDSETETETDSETDTGGEPLTDEELMRAAIAGEVDPDEALTTIAGRGGLPVITEEGTFLFGCLCGAGSWQLAGDHDGWAGAEMDQTDELWSIEVAIFEPDGSIYKFYDGQDYFPDPMGRRYGYDNFGEYSLVRATAPHLERWFGLSGYGLGPRNLQVWVPQDGAFTHALYVHDGQNLFDPEALFGGWKFNETLPDGMLVVGIDNTGVDRIDEYTHVMDEIQGMAAGGLGDSYADLVELDIRPRMEEAYGLPEVVGTMGSSLGGLIAFHIADRHPDRYDMALSMSGTMGWGSIGDGVHEETMIERYVAAGHRSTALYLDSGGNANTCVDADDDGIEDDGDGTDNFCENNQFRDALANIGYTFDVDLWHWHEPGAPHNESAWAARLAYPLELFSQL